MVQFITLRMHKPWCKSIKIKTSLLRNIKFNPKQWWWRWWWWWWINHRPYPNSAPYPHPSVLHIPAQGSVSHFFGGPRGSGDLALQTEHFQMQSPNVGGDRNRHVLLKSTSFIRRRRYLLLTSFLLHVFIKRSMMITAHATGKTTAGTGIVKIYGSSLSCYIYAVTAADDVMSGVPLPR